MSILKIPGWANHEIINEGRLHNDKLKDKIGKMFDRLSLGYSPNHVIDKIANIIKIEKGDKFDYTKVTNDDIINIANSDFVTRGKFTPSLRPSFAAEYQNTNNVSEVETPSVEPVSLDFSAPASTDTTSLPIGGLPSEDSEEYGSEEYGSEDSEEYDSSEDSEDEEEKAEDAEEVKTCKCHKDDAVFNPEIAKKSFDKTSNPKSLESKTSGTHRESVRLSTKAVNQLLKEDYIKQRQHLSRIEERYGRR
jgi:hypothetical protein